MGGLWLVIETPHKMKLQSATTVNTATKIILAPYGKQLYYTVAPFWHACALWKSLTSCSFYLCSSIMLLHTITQLFKPLYFTQMLKPTKEVNWMEAGVRWNIKAEKDWLKVVEAAVGCVSVVRTCPLCYGRTGMWQLSQWVGLHSRC